MLAGTIYDTLVTTLGGSANLDYIKNVYKGLRYEQGPGDFPYIAVEPADNGELFQQVDTNEKLWFTVDIFAYVRIDTKKDAMITGDGVYKGILNVENDIRETLLNSNGADNLGILTNFAPTVFDPYTQFPVRALQMPVRFLYQQTGGV